MTTEPYRGHAPFVSGSITSEMAAGDIQETTHTLRLKVLAFIKSRGAQGATDEEIQTALAMTGNTERPRRRELYLAGKIKQAGFNRKTKSGRAAVVWVAA